jgi:hypothetical protein
MKLEEIATDVDYRELGFLESTIMHEAKRKGYRAVLDKSKQYLEQYPENDYEYNLLCGLFNYFAVRVYGFEMYEPRRTKKVINPYMLDMLLDGEVQEDEVSEDGCLLEFLRCNILKTKLDEVF